ncbi:D-arabinose 1-dehydrogenase-like Zn-dependent alcohol dehydrogenase [Rhizobium binae]|uniref:D-arabinose 1-dehydrogenase-like Zn-dependent alcohol dehydrogenase n=1 Tax=Rhizobium binae TaxID=1138190 RepID=A0ABV2MJ13_9HYPH
MPGKMMKAAVVREFGKPLAIECVAVPGQAQARYW